jgi:hypothetical protein
MTAIETHNVKCQRNDYIFSIQLDTGGAAFNNLQYTRLIGIQFPLFALVDIMIFNRDCI